MQERAPIEEYVLSEDMEYAEKSGWFGGFKDFVNGRYFLAVLTVIAIILAFFLGRISSIQDKKVPIRVISEGSQNQIYNTQETKNQSANVGDNYLTNKAVADTSSVEKVVASKSGTKYHYPWCAGAKQISEKNLITFNSIEEARAKGYTPALNCKGLK